MCAPKSPVDPKTVDHRRVDCELGARIKARRRALGLSQTWLGTQVGVTCQQVQKYESGKNRVSASALVALADALSTTSAALLAGLGGSDDAPPAMAWAASADGAAAYTALHRLAPDAFAAVLGAARAIGALAHTGRAAE